MEDKMKNWEIMAVLKIKQEGESWGCPALRARNKRTCVGWPFKSNSPPPAPVLTAGIPVSRGVSLQARP